MRLFLHGRSPASMLRKRLRDTKTSKIGCLLLSGWSFDNSENSVDGSCEMLPSLLQFLQYHSELKEVILHNCSGSQLETLILDILQSPLQILTIRFDQQQNIPNEIMTGLLQGAPSRIRQFNLRGVTLTPVTLEALQLAIPENLPRLETLSIKGNIPVSDADEGMTILGSADDSESYFAMEESINRMTSLLLDLSSLQSLELEYCHLDDSHLALLLNAALSSSDIYTLNLKGNQCQERTMKVLARHLQSDLCCLETIDLTWQRVPEYLPSVQSAAAKNLFRALTPLRGLPVLAKALTKNMTLKKLILSENKIRPMDVEIMTLSIESNRTLEALELKDCRLNSESMFLISQRLPRLQLKALHIDGIQKISHEEEKETLASLFVEALVFNVHINDLALNCQSDSIDWLLEWNQAGRPFIEKSEIPDAVFPLIQGIENQRQSDDLPSPSTRSETTAIGSSGMLIAT